MTVPNSTQGTVHGPDCIHIWRYMDLCMSAVTVNVKYNICEISGVHALVGSQLFRGCMAESFTHMDAHVDDNTWYVANRMQTFVSDNDVDI